MVLDWGDQIIKVPEARMRRRMIQYIRKGAVWADMETCTRFVRGKKVHVYLLYNTYDVWAWDARSMNQRIRNVWRVVLNVGFFNTLAMTSVEIDTYKIWQDMGGLYEGPSEWWKLVYRCSVLRHCNRIGSIGLDEENQKKPVISFRKKILFFAKLSGRKICTCGSRQIPSTSNARSFSCII